MKGVTVKQPGGAEQLDYREFPLPEPQAGELLIRVHAAAVNRTDIVTREGRMDYAKNPVLGVEVAGIVENANGHETFQKGDRVMGLVNGGGYAEYAVMPADRAMMIPEPFSFEQAAAIPEVFLTAYQTLYWIGKLQQKETVLIHAGASGVGTAAIQLAKQYTGATVIVTAGSEEKLNYCKNLGADVAINYKEQSFNEEVKKATNGQGADLILDFIGASYWEKNMESIKTDGRWVLIGVLSGRNIENMNLFQLMAKRVQLTGTLLTPRSDAYKAELTKDFSEAIFPYFQEKKVAPIVDKVFSVTQASEAHRYMEDNKNIGKIVLQVP
ncbi:putative NAD(P)H quinone oxidoreductase, PIG3 family [Alteribacillus persepolensis]|uniref:Putative NAD(P)H quinone oxidoreductase, PIG3 family n=1 Tax=Alteribacillus persepolensis TaxID=568899 RepID=A0A1G8BZ80_9BACI|nr:NAD(P)H-quinone oxidoreductase [Alteribacillus persepolensis]SDH38526.1 putative NAD(P)H quinone oxidoreductase, PIG3 family [Alteribacillus persepolensis]